MMIRMMIIIDIGKNTGGIYNVYGNGNRYESDNSSWRALRGLGTPSMPKNQLIILGKNRKKR